MKPEKRLPSQGNDRDEKTKMQSADFLLDIIAVQL